MVLHSVMLGNIFSIMMTSKNSSPFLHCVQVRRRVFLEGEELEAFREKEKLAKQQAEK